MACTSNAPRDRTTITVTVASTPDGVDLAVSDPPLEDVIAHLYQKPAVSG